jgi:5'-nucleotidase/UDP-sugar diphosphatase
MGWLVVVGLVSSATAVTILYTNDVHVRLDRLDSLAALIEEERANSGLVLLLDAGDAWQDFRRPLPAVWGVDEMVRWMNAVGYSGMALGNHDLYWGAERLAELVNQAEFPVLCASLVPAASFKVPFASSAVVETDAMRILLVGLITHEHLPYVDYPWLRYVRPEEAVDREIRALDAPVDLIVAVGHLPVGGAAYIAERVPQIDVFISGHSHEETAMPVRVGRTLIVQSGAFGQNLGRLRLDVQAESVALLDHELLPTARAPVSADRGLRQLVRVALALSAVALLLSL